MIGIQLTPREQDILNLLCQGYSNDAIAEHLVLSLGTVKWYNKQIFAKLGVNNRVQAALAANELGLLNAISDISPQQPLPFPLTSFIGRTEIITKVCTLLHDHRLVTIVGQGGIGKTRLALEVARHVQDNDHLTSAFVSLVEYSQPEAVILAIANSFGITVRSQNTALQQVIETLSYQPSLLVLDNFEHLLSAADTLVTILRSAPNVKLLITSRERLDLYGETVFRLVGLTVPTRDDLDHARNNDSVKLFVDRARHADANFQPTDDELKQIIDICELLQGMPLAIEHAASWIHILDTNAILSELERGLDILHTNLRGLEPRHQSIRAVIGRSWERLTPHEQHALMRLSLFRGGFGRDAAAYVAQADLDILTGLIAKSFVARSGADRYDLHELHRQFAFEKLTATGGVAVAREQYIHFFKKLVQDIAPQRWNMEPEQLAALDRLDDEYANLREVVQWSLLEGDACTALHILGYGAIFFHDRGHGVETIGWTRDALNRCTDEDPSLRVRAYFALALQDVSMTDDEHKEYLNWAERSKNLELIAVAYWQCGDHAAYNQSCDQAQRHYEYALELAAQTDYQNLYSIILSYMGHLAELCGSLETATGYYREAYEHMRVLGVRSATRPRNLARMLLLKGEETSARELFRTAIDNAIYLKSPLWTCETLFVIASYLQEKADWHSALQLFAACQTLALSLRLPTAEFEIKVEEVREQLGKDEFDSLWKAAKSLSTAGATALAQQALEEPL